MTTNGYGLRRKDSDGVTLTSSPPQMEPLSSSSSHDSREIPDIIPPESPSRSRTLVLCFDGTGDQFDSDNSNIVELFTTLKKDDRDQQMCYYQAGIGTYTNPEIATPLMAKVSKTLDEAIAWNLNAHVMDGYEFLMQNYKAGDRISIFGFSRGAYTARALAGMIHKVGLLPACNHQQIPFAYKMFTSVDETGWKQSNIFKKAFSVDVKIDFIGVWDTVNSVGLISRRLPFTTSNTIVRAFRHAVALDERRAKFKANLWNRPTKKEQSLDAVPPPEQVKKHPKPHPTKKHTLKAMEKKYSQEQDKPTDIEEVWFAGCHCDVGGGSVDNGTPHTLARIPLRWMIRECFKAETGIMFHADGLRNLGIDPVNLYPIVQQRPDRLAANGAFIQHIPPKTKVPKPVATDENLHVNTNGGAGEVTFMSEEEHERLDALSPIYDQLELAWFWWLLEYFPMKQSHQRDDNTWKKEYSFNRGQGRHVPKQKKGIVKIHRSVQTRMEAMYESGKVYESKASFADALKLGNVMWID
ncbi:hypothetical protein BDZ94DRAFT_1295336 [Collybia nuda]|uniref:T6SS Phospholipase effector Tle1-like catalytic domain-containing protein n=1 Tax=Collybia nuda TaxID=64659 RepID=A0A9P5YE47_9AGAR|nr:hypothetical protein BDZ94DRAFT_1295336 [Collybia nuda]